MKISDGFWMTKKGYNVSYASQAYEVRTGSDRIEVNATPSVIYNRGMTLGGPNLEITYTAPRRDILRVTIVHYRGAADNAPEFNISCDDANIPDISSDERGASITSGGLCAEISRGEWNVGFSYKGRPLTHIGGRCTSYITDDSAKPYEKPSLGENQRFYEYPENGFHAYLREQLSLGVGEYVYGFGERFTPFVKNGQRVDTWNSDGGTCTEQSYKSVPFYITSEGYGVLVNYAGNVSFEVASDTVSRVSFTVPGEKLEYFIIGGDNLLEVMKNYTALTGRPALPPAYTFGLWLSTSFTTNYDEKTINSFIDGMAERDIPLQIFHFDCFWMREFEWTSFEWDTRQFPDPAGMLKRLRERGLGVCVWINPYIGQRSRLFGEGMERGYFLRDPAGNVLQVDMWQPGMAIVDFTNPAACEWYAGYLRGLCEMGVTNFKTDFGERIPSYAVYYNGADGVTMHNYYTYLYNQTVFGVLREYYGEDKACVFARSATVGSQSFPVHWGGDCSAQYVSMAETLRGGLSLCSSGFGFFSHDIGGFEQTASPDVYKRWCAFGLLSTHSRLHGSTSYRVPWLFEEKNETGADAVETLRFFVKLKGKLMPYLYSEAIKTARDGVPMLRPMIMQYRDTPCKTLDTQYMLGSSLLCAPVFTPDGSVEFYLPDCGVWTDIITGEQYAGGRYYSKICSYLEMPCLAAPGSIIAYGDFKSNFEYDYLSGARFVIYSLADGGVASCDIPDTSGHIVYTLTAKNVGGKYHISAPMTDAAITVSIFGGAQKTFVPDGGESVI